MKASNILWAALLSFPLGVHAADIVIVNNDSAGEGFNDLTPVAAAPGNPATTIGAQRLNVFEAAAQFWEERLDSNVQISIDSAFNPLACSQFGAVLGSAGARGSYYRDFAGAPKTNTWYVQAITNSIVNFDTNSSNDIEATFNSDIDNNNNCLINTNWWYGINAQAPSNTVDLYNTVIHEIAHGLGFANGANRSTGQLIGDAAGRHPISFGDRLKNQQTGSDWRSMTDAERLSSMTATGQLVWTGTKANAESDFITTGKNAGQLQMYAPNPIEPGSSVSHWDTAISPNEVMEPSSTAVNEAWLSIKAMYDIGWNGTPCPTIEMPHNSWVLAALSCELPVGDTTVGTVMGNRLSGVQGTDWAAYGYNEATGAYFPLAANATLVQGEAYWIIQASGSPVTLELSQDSHRPDRQVSSACASTLGCYSIALSSNAGQDTVNTVGNTFPRGIAWDDIRFKTSTGACQNGCSPADAQSNNVASNFAYSYDSLASGYVTVSSGATIAATDGLWINLKPGANGLNPEMLVPVK